MNTSNDSDISSTGDREKKTPLLPLDYSPIRHRACIERILHALEGLDPRLDSAPKLWTFFALAKVFDVATAPAISNHILAWLYEFSNALLIEIHPEIAYRIASGIQSTDLCHQTFAILVGEEALLLLRDAQLQPDTSRPSKTFHGRVRETLNDSEVQRIEYASKGFLDRVLGIFIDLVGTEMSWLTDLINRQLDAAGIFPDTAIVSSFICCVKEYVRGRIYARLLQTARTYTPVHLLIGPIQAGYPHQDFVEAYNRMKPVERILSRTFWMLLRRESFREDWESDFPAFRHRSIAELADHLPPFQNQIHAVLRPVPRSELRALAFSDARPWPHSMLSALRPMNHHHLSPEIDYLSLLSGACQHIKSISEKMLDPPEPEPSQKNMLFQFVDTLTCLTNDEYKFLPLWAGGNDDDSGGVFAGDSAPFLESGGFSAPGPNIHSGSAAPSDDSFTIMASSEAITTVQGASHRAMASLTEVISLRSTTGSLQRGLAQMDIRSVETESLGAETLGTIDEFHDDDTQVETLAGGTVTMPDFPDFDLVDDFDFDNDDDDDDDDDDSDDNDDNDDIDDQDKEFDMD